ncbi:MAG TPA: ATP synthase F1 subunit delta, partial [Victivallales bacterium]|nr:ATP synthase F1 subunit delta [Victivallales bacterium]
MKAGNEISKHYALAFFEIACERGALCELASDVEMIRDILEQETVAYEFLASPASGKEQKKRLIERAFSPWINTLTSNLLAILVEKNRLEFLKDICKEFKLLYDLKNGISKARLVSAKTLGDAERSDLKKRLDERFSKNFLIEYFCDSNLIAGFKFMFGDTMFDCSASSML